MGEGKGAFRHRVLNASKLGEIKTQVHKEIKGIRTGASDEVNDDEEKDKAKKIKFCNFILNLASKGAMRRWKE